MSYFSYLEDSLKICDLIHLPSAVYVRGKEWCREVPSYDAEYANFILNFLLKNLCPNECSDGFLRQTLGEGRGRLRKTRG